MEISALAEPGSYLGGVAFHPREPILTTRDDGKNTVRIWDVDMDALAGTSARTTPVYYTNAKVVLAGDTGVGKSALANALLGKEYTPTDSTHAQRVHTFESNEVDLPGQATETRETFLWDLAGQPVYRVTHQLHLQEMAVALVVFTTSGGGDPLASVRYWDCALAQAHASQPGSTPTLVKFLVAAKVENGRPGTSKERIQALKDKGGYKEYFETSSKENKQIKELREAIKEAIPWDKLPRVGLTTCFRASKDSWFRHAQGGRCSPPLRACTTPL